MKIAYLSDSIIPSRYANAVNVVKTCDAFAKSGHEVMLFARYGKLFAGDDYKRYGVSPGFRIIKCWRPNLFLPKKLRRKVYNFQVKYHMKKNPKLQ